MSGEWWMLLRKQTQEVQAGQVDSDVDWELAE